MRNNSASYSANRPLVAVAGTGGGGAWLWLLVAAGFEIAFALSLKQTEGFTRLGPSVLTVVLVFISVFLLSKTLTRLPLGTAYAAWTGIGAVGTVSLGMAFLGDPVTVARLFFIALIITGAVGLNIVEKRTCRRTLTDEGDSPSADQPQPAERSPEIAGA